MANQKGETTSIGHFYNRCVDAVNNLFDTMSFWTHSKDVEFVDGKTAETKVGAINGITSDISGEADDIAASIKCVKELSASLNVKSIGKYVNIPANGYIGITFETEGAYAVIGIVTGGADLAITSFSANNTIEISLNNLTSTNFTNKPIYVSYLARP